MSSGTGAEGSTPTMPLAGAVTIGAGPRKRNSSANANGESTDKLERAVEKEQTASRQVHQERGASAGRHKHWHSSTANDKKEDDGTGRIEAGSTQKT